MHELQKRRPKGLLSGNGGFCCFLLRLIVHQPDGQAEHAVLRLDLQTAAILPGLSLIHISVEDGYIPAPYTADASQSPTEYVAPVFYHNEDGLTISVTYNGVIAEGRCV